MYLWRRLACASWPIANEERLKTLTDCGFAIIERPGRKRIQVEAYCVSKHKAGHLKKAFGGRVMFVPKSFGFAGVPKIKPIRIGNRLTIIGSSEKRVHSTRRQTAGRKSALVIPAGAAFGTGEHVTTAMSLRLLERISRAWGAHASRRKIFGSSKNVARGAQRSTRGRVRSPEQWSLFDIGTGSGILALAAARFGASKVLGIDNDRTAIRIAKENAAANRISHIQFRFADVLNWKPHSRVDVVTANLFSELLIRILPMLRQSLNPGGCLITSGILREQEADVARALKRDGFRAATIRRRGKWVAILAALSERRPN